MLKSESEMCLNSTEVDGELLASEGDVIQGCFRLLYTAPEAILDREVWKQLLVKYPLSSTVVGVAVDEAHCVFKW